MKLTDIIKGSEYDLSLFTEAQISELESRIVERQTKKGTEYYITCTVRKRILRLLPRKWCANYICWLSPMIWAIRFLE